MRLWFLVPVGVLLIALLPLPYGYYMFLRLIVSIAALLGGYASHRERKRVNFGVIGSGIVAVAFNPIVPLFLNRGIWSAIDVVAAAWFLFLALRPASAT